MARTAQEKRAKAKAKAAAAASAGGGGGAADSASPVGGAAPAADAGPAVEVEYVAEQLNEAEVPEELKAVFAKFLPVEQLLSGPAAAAAAAAGAAAAADAEDASGAGAQQDAEGEGEGEGEEEGEGAAARPGKRKRRLAERLSVSELKQVVARPDLVESHDVASPASLLLLGLKACRNTVAVPRHWSNMKKYLQGRRGKDRVSYRLPDFIAQTGINKIRAALAEQEAAAKARRKARQRVNPSMGKMDIDYQVLHDAFFKHQTRPALRRAGELYHEGAEGEMAVAEATRAFRPGRISAALLAALEMPDASAPPPWLLSMQRYGPPPAYPSLKVPGVNAPIPKGAAWGMHPGGWGTAPVDAAGRGVYGDVFGTAMAQLRSDEETVDRTRWGEALSDSEEEDAEDGQEEQEADAGAEEGDGLEDELSDKRAREAQEEEAAAAAKLAATAQLEASAKEAAARAAQARQAAISSAQAAALPHQSGELFTVIKQKQNDVGGGLFAGDYTYEVAAGGGAGAAAAAALKQAAAGNPPKDKAAQQQQQQQQQQQSKKRPAPQADEEEELEAGFKF